MTKLRTILVIVGAAALLALLIWLKVLRWILLGLALLLGLVLLLAALVLFVPLRYRLQAAMDGPDPEGRGRISWLLGLLRADVTYSERSLHWSARVLGIKAASSEKKKPTEAAAPMTGEPTPEPEENPASTAVPSLKPKEKKKRKKKEAKNLRKLWTILREDKAAFGKILQGAFRCLRQIFPRSCDLYIRFGTGDPAQTGQLYGIYWALRPMLIPAGKEKRRLRLEADFQEKVLQAEGWARGHFNIAGLLGAMLKVVLSAEVRKLYKDFKKSEQ